MRLFFAVLLFTLVPIGALAAGRAWIINEAASNIRIVELQGLEQGSVDYECVTFQNTGAQAVKDVLFRFTYISSERRVVGFDTLERRGQFAPGMVDGIPHHAGVTHDRTFYWDRFPGCQTYHVPHEGLAILAVNVERVEFADGTMWLNQHRSAATPEPSPSP